MAVSSCRSDGLTPHQLELLYEPIILEAALQKAGSLPTYTQESQSSQGYKAEYVPEILRINETSTASVEDSGQESNASTVPDDESIESLEHSTSTVSLGDGDE
ncbi:hypothetical protein DER45DRAFT_619802 [Fusarium avenaceum]|nr:hypothetical protein DER45DRAFT_619802 [Fusarium avenaceum]